MRQNERLDKCIERIANGTASDEDILFYNAWYEAMPSKVQDPDVFQQISPVLLKRIHGEVRRLEKAERRKFIRRMTAAAAIVLVSLSAALYLFGSAESDRLGSMTADIAPGGNKATIMLDDRTIVLDETKAGVVWENGRFVYSDGTPLDMEGAAGVNVNEPFATLVTPKGGQYQITLADGTRVWLNAASTLRYPTRFSDSVRAVQLVGEAYFEVAHNKNAPFKVQTAVQEVEVLGTDFNVAAYPDEAFVKTTLLEGSVRVSGGRGSKAMQLVPGEQSILSAQGLRKETVNTRMAVAWKEGDFIFDDDIQTIMRQIERWYDVEVIYQDEIPHVKLVGKIARDKKLSAVLKVLEAAGKVRFKVDERRITVMN